MRQEGLRGLRFARDRKYKFRVFVARSDDRQPVGYVSVGETMNPTVGLRLGAVLDLWVEPRSRNQGAGSMLLDYAIEYLQSREYTYASIMVSAGNRRVMAMYRRRGFRPDRVNLVRRLPRGA